METLSLNSKERNEFIDITSWVEAVVKKAAVDRGICVVFCPHTTAAITINENADSSVQKDIINYLNQMVPANKNYLHAEGNSDSHIKSSLLGASSRLIIEGGRLVLGTWQGIYFCEFDGPRSRKVYIQAIGK